MRDEDKTKEQLCQELADLRARLTEQQQELAAQRTQKLESMRALAGRIAHDFNNLLTAIMGNANLAAFTLRGSSSRALAFVERIEEAATAAVERTTLLLAYSGRGELALSRLDLTELVDSLDDLLQDHIPQDIELKYDLAPNVVAAQADRSKLQQVILSLATNAAEAIGDGDGAVTVATCITHLDEPSSPGDSLPAGSYACIQVSDSGCGMSREAVVEMFDPSFTTKGSGRGLGLATAQVIVHRHHGAILVDSELGRGTTVRVLLPAGTTAKAARPVPQDVPDSGSASSCRVLLVDDEEVVRKVTTAMLTALGMQVTAAADGHQAVALFREQAGSIGVVLLDLTMPTLSGEQVFAKLREIRSDVPVIFSSGFDESARLSSFEGTAFLKKPYQIDKLREQVRKVTGQGGRKGEGAA